MWQIQREPVVTESKGNALTSCASSCASWWPSPCSALASPPSHRSGRAPSPPSRGGPAPISKRMRRNDELFIMVDGKAVVFTPADVGLARCEIVTPQFNSVIGRDVCALLVNGRRRPRLYHAKTTSALSFFYCVTAETFVQMLQSAHFRTLCAGVRSYGNWLVLKCALLESIAERKRGNNCARGSTSRMSEVLGRPVVGAGARAGLARAPTARLDGGTDADDALAEVLDLLAGHEASQNQIKAELAETRAENRALHGKLDALLARSGASSRSLAPPAADQD